jgi:hypothetical protein
MTVYLILGLGQSLEADIPDYMDNKIIDLDPNYYFGTLTTE